MEDVYETEFTKLYDEITEECNFESGTIKSAV
jgi:hypothetical protein